MEDNWYKDKRFDHINLRMAETINTYSKGISFMNQYNLVAAFLRIKPLQTIGFKVSDSSIIDYWIRINPKPDTAKYIMRNKQFIMDLHKSKMRFRNQHLLLAIFSGHFENWLKFQLNRSNNKPYCSICNAFISRNNLFTKGTCCGLVSVGAVPRDKVSNRSHTEFLK